MRAVPALLAFLFLAIVSGAPARADEPVIETQKIISRQIEAFLAEDAATAYSFAAPGIVARYPDKEAFFAMVRKSYAPVYSPGNYAFGRNKILRDGAMVVHEVLITGRDGREWTAIYMLAKQPDGSFKIGGVNIMPNTTSKGI